MGGTPARLGPVEVFTRKEEKKKKELERFSSCPCHIFHIVAYAPRSTLQSVADRKPCWAILLKGFQADAESARQLAPSEVKEGAAFFTSLRLQRAARNGWEERTFCGRN